MSIVRKNIIANLIGSGWVALISIAFIPFYIHLMGVESYGLVGFYLTLQSLFAILDMGLTTTVSRELARLSASNDNAQSMRNLVRTLEVIYWVLSALIVVVIVLLAPWVATQWLNVHDLSVETVQQAIVLMGVMIGLRMPYGFYSGGLLGLQRQVLLNVIKISVETLKSGGAVLVLLWVSPTVTAFFQWQLLISAFGVCLMVVAIWRCLPPVEEEKTLFQIFIFRKLWRFTAGMSAITVMSAILVQMDKVVLSRMLSLDTFAYYSLASTVAAGLYVITGPVFSAVYPQFTQLVANNELDKLKHLYHKSCQLMTVLVMPLAITISFFSAQILQVWTQNEVVSEHAAPILSVLIIGSALSGMMSLPFALQLAHGWIRLALGLNVVAVIVLLPALILAIEVYGASGAAAIWLLLNAASVAFGLVLMHRKVLRGELNNWLVTDFGLPSLASLSVIVCFWLALPENLGGFGQLIWIMIASFAAFGCSLLAAPTIRHGVMHKVLRISK